MAKVSYVTDDGREALLKRLMEETGIKTKQDLIDNAVIAFEWAVEQKKAGRSIVSVDREEKPIRELVVPSLESVKVPEAVEVVSEQPTGVHEASTGEAREVLLEDENEFKKFLDEQARELKQSNDSFERAQLDQLIWEKVNKLTKKQRESIIMGYFSSAAAAAETIDEQWANTIAINVRTLEEEIKRLGDRLEVIEKEKEAADEELATVKGMGEAVSEGERESFKSMGGGVIEANLSQAYLSGADLNWANLSETLSETEMEVLKGIQEGFSGESELSAPMYEAVAAALAGRKGAVWSEGVAERSEEVGGELTVQEWTEMAAARGLREAAKDLAAEGIAEVAEGSAVVDALETGNIIAYLAAMHKGEAAEDMPESVEEEDEG